MNLPVLLQIVGLAAFVVAALILASAGVAVLVAGGCLLVAGVALERER